MCSPRKPASLSYTALQLSDAEKSKSKSKSKNKNKNENKPKVIPIAGGKKRSRIGGEVQTKRGRAVEGMPLGMASWETSPSSERHGGWPNGDTIRMIV
ncbi:hypothetical protein Taro_020851 [Colocasia esculenta]|uniref:Uncharacterized protein n=1 Tax=Colocasia esculenta TaxID=4460 RepID=A0A843UXG4_COLES|nr:hypothetical protein [Colocasia esculenta]